MANVAPLSSYLPPPMANESRFPLMKKVFSPVHLKHWRETEDQTGVLHSPQGAIVSLADLEARVEHEEEGLSRAVEGVTGPQWVGEKASKHLEQHAERTRNVRENHIYKNAPTLPIPHPSCLLQSFQCLLQSFHSSSGSMLHQIKHHLVHNDSAHVSTT